MFDSILTDFKQLPVKDRDRKCTDICCTLFSFLFSLIMFIFAFVYMNKDNYLKANFPTDSDYQPCSYGKNKDFGFVYFPDINDITTRVCVGSCPQNSSVEIECSPNTKVPSCLSVYTYNTKAEIKRMGGYCLPSNEQQEKILLKNLNTNSKNQFFSNYDSVRRSLILSLFVGIIWMSLMQIIPRPMATVALFFASVMFFAIGVVFLVDNDAGWKGSPFRIILACVLIVMSLFFLALIWIYNKHLKIMGILLHYASTFIAAKPVNFIFIPIFLLCSVGLILLCFFQYLAFASNNQPIQNGSDIYLHLTQNVTLTVLTIIQFIWGVQFLKDTFNFFLSGNASEWYMKGSRGSNCCDPVKRFFKYNFGSVAGGSFLNAFFNIFGFLYESLRCYPDGACGVCAPCCSNCYKFFGCFFDLIRNDVYAYINLTGIPYCNSARNCQTLCENSKLFVGNQSVMYFYRSCAQISCISVVFLLSYFTMKIANGQITITSLLLIILFAYIICSFFIDLTADCADALVISYLLELELKGGNPDNLSQIFKGLKGQMRIINDAHKITSY